MELHRFWFKKFTPIYDRLALEINRCLQEAHVQMDDQRKDHINPEGALQGNGPKNQKTHNLHTNDMENIYSTNKERDLLLANKPQIVS